MEVKIKPSWWTAHLNWQKMSAYSAEMLEACRTVTLKVKTLPILRCSSASSGASRLAFSGASTSSAPAGRNAEINSLMSAFKVAGQVEPIVSEPQLRFRTQGSSFWTSVGPKNPDHLESDGITLAARCARYRPLFGHVGRNIHTFSHPNIQHIQPFTRKYDYPHMCCCWPHQLTVPFLRSALHLPQYEAPPGISQYGTVRQSRSLTGTTRERCKTDWLASWEVNPVCATYGNFLYLFILLILKWDFGSAGLPHSWAVVGSFLISWRETQSTFTSLPQEVPHSLPFSKPFTPFVSVAEMLRIRALPDMACTATRRKPFTSPFSLTMATRWTRGTGYSRLLR